MTMRKLDRAAIGTGAWMIKCNPKTWDIGGFVADRHSHIGGWRVQNNYRTALMEPGDRCFLWVTAGSRQIPPGVWARGEVSGRAAIDDGDDYWANAAEADGRLYIPLDVTIVQNAALKPDLVADPRFAAAEVIRSPQMGNPLFLTDSEVNAIDDLL